MTVTCEYIRLTRGMDFKVFGGKDTLIYSAIAAGAAGQPDVCKAIIAANRSCGLPVTTSYSPEQLTEAALSDKKRKGDRITLVLPERIGKCRLEKIDISMLEDAFRRGLAMAEALA